MDSLCYDTYQLNNKKLSFKNQKTDRSLIIKSSESDHPKTIKKYNLELNPKEQKEVLNYIQIITQKLYRWSG